MTKKSLKNSIVLFSTDNNEPNWIKDYRLEAYKQIDEHNHPSFGPEIKLDIELEKYFENKFIPFEYDGDGFIACDIHTAFRKYPGLIDKYYGKLISADENRYTVLNSTVFESGYFIYVYKEQKLNFPIFNKNVNCDFSKNIIIVDEDSELNIVDYCHTDALFKSDCTEVFVEKNAKCRYLNINNNSNNSTIVSLKRAKVEENGSMDWINIIEGSSIYMGYPSTILKGIRSKSNSKTLVVSANKSSINIGAKMIHEGKLTKSNVENISYVNDNSEVEVRNSINIHKNAIASTANVLNTYSSNSGTSKFDVVPKYIVSNDSSNINFRINNAEEEVNLIDYIDNNFIQLSKMNKKYLQELIKREM